jgi:hypothetical protein
MPMTPIMAHHIGHGFSAVILKSYDLGGLNATMKNVVPGGDT